MNNPQIVSSVIGVIIAATIYWLVRRDHLAPGQALKWIFVSLVVLLLGTFPVIVDWLGHSLGIAYPPIIPLILGLAAAMIKILLMDIERTKRYITQERIIQKLAILETEVATLKAKDESKKTLKR